MALPHVWVLPRVGVVVDFDWPGGGAVAVLPCTAAALAHIRS